MLHRAPLIGRSRAGTAKHHGTELQRPTVVSRVPAIGAFRLFEDVRSQADADYDDIERILVMVSSSSKPLNQTSNMVSSRNSS